MIEIICFRGLGDKEMNSIEDSLISSEAMAIRRGTYAIDSQWYLVHNNSIEVPHKKTDSDEALMDGDLIEISDSNFGISGNKLVKRITISGSITEIIDRIEIASFEELI